MSDDVKLPTTVEEYQRARRDAFLRGMQQFYTSPGGVEQAKRAYPIRRKVPRVVAAPDGIHRRYTVREDEEGLSVVMSQDGEEVEKWFTAAEVRIMADLTTRPYEEVEE